MQRNCDVTHRMVDYYSYIRYISSGRCETVLVDSVPYLVYVTWEIMIRLLGAEGVCKMSALLPYSGLRPDFASAQPSHPYPGQGLNMRDTTATYFISRHDTEHRS